MLYSLQYTCKTITGGNNTGWVIKQRYMNEADKDFQIPDGIICKIDLIVFCMLDVFFLDKLAKNIYFLHGTISLKALANQMSK